MKKKESQNLYNLFLKEKKFFFIITLSFLIIGFIIDLYQKFNSPKLFTIIIDTYSLDKYNQELDKIFEKEKLDLKYINFLDSMSTEISNVLEYDKPLRNKVLISENVYPLDRLKDLKVDDKKFFINDFYYRRNLAFSGEGSKSQFIISYKSKQQLPNNIVKNIIEKSEKLAKKNILNNKLKLFNKQQEKIYITNSISFYTRIEFLNYHLKLAKKLGIEKSNSNHGGIEYFKNGYKNIEIELTTLKTINPKDSSHIFYNKENFLKYPINYENFKKLINKIEKFIIEIKFFKAIQLIETTQINPDKKFTIPFAFSGFFISFFVILLKLQKISKI